MITALITDYERAILDALRADAHLRDMIEYISNLPATAEHEERNRRLYDRLIMERKITLQEAAEELANHDRAQADYAISYKAGGL